MVENKLYTIPLYRGWHIKLRFKPIKVYCTCTSKLEEMLHVYIKLIVNYEYR